MNDLSPEEFKRRLQHNVATIKGHIKNNRFCANDYHFVDHPLEDNHFLVSRRFFDIVAATVIGALPVDALNGIDSYRLKEDGTYEAVEVKLVELHTRGAFRTDKGSIYYGPAPTANANKRVSLRSKFRASFEIYNNISSKNVPTVLVLFDTENHKIVDAIEMHGEQIMRYLSNVLDGTGKIVKEKKTAKRTIALSAFLNHGKKSNTTIKVSGFENWELHVRGKDLPTITYA